MRSTPRDRTRPADGRPIDRRQFVIGAAGIGVGLLAFGAAGCGGDDAGGSGTGGGEGSRQVAFAQPDTSSAIYPLLLAGAKRAADRRGYTLLESHANAQLDRQVSELNTWIAQGVGGIMVLPLDNAAMGPIVRKANEADVKILSYSDRALEGTDGWVIFDNLQGARLVGDAAAAWVNRTLGGKAKVALLTHEIQQTGRERIGGAVEALRAGAPGVEVVARHEGVLAADVLPVVQSMLQATPDINVILCIADDGCLGAERAFMQTKPSQKRIDEMYIAGWDGSIPIFEKILSGGPIRATGALDAIAIGEAAVDATIDAVEGSGETEVNFPYVLASQDDPAAVEKLLAAYRAVVSD